MSLALLLVAVTVGQLNADTPSSLMIGPPPMIMDDVDPTCWNFTYGNWRIQEFYTPNYPGEYLNTTDCVLYLEAPHGFRIHLDFRDKFILEKSEGCRYDYLEVRDGPFAYSPVIGRYCSAEFPPIITSSGRYLWLRFKTDDLLQYGGFRAVYSYHKDQTQNDGGWVSKESSGSCRIPLKLTSEEADGLLSSDDVPFDVATDPSVAKGQTVDCTWEIYADRGYQIYLRSLEIEMKHRKRCDMNNLTIYERTTLDSAVKEEFCRGNNEIMDITSDSNRVFVRLFGRSISDKPRIRITYTLVRKGDCSELEFRCGEICLPASLLCNGVENCKDRSDEKSCTRTRPVKGRPHVGASGNRNDIDGVGKTSGGDNRPGGSVDDSVEDSSMVPLHMIILGAVGGVILTCVCISACVVCRIRRRNKRKRQETAQQKTTQRNALEMAVCNSNTTLSLSRANNEGQGLKPGDLSDRQHYMTSSKVNPVSPTCIKDTSHRYSFTDHGISTSIDDVIPDQMTQSGNYKRFLTMDITPDDIMGNSMHTHLHGKYPPSPVGVMGMTHLDHRMTDAYQNYHGNQWHPGLNEEGVMYPYGSPTMTLSSPFLGLSKPFSYSQPESKYESKYLKALKAKENDTIKEYTSS